MQRLLFPTVFSLTVSSLCATDSPGKTEHEALYTQSAVNVDGKLDEPVWKQAKVYPMHVAVRPTESGVEAAAKLTENAKVQLAWDDEYVYLAANLEDADVVAETNEDNAHHYRTGDILELFLRPAGKPCYWELYGVPNGRQSTFFYPSKGRVFLPSSVVSGMGMKTAAVVHGTLNDPSDKDQGWTLEMAVPLKELTAKGGIVSAGAPPWQILISRYNYSVYHEIYGGELSASSEEPSSNFHDSRHWGTLRFVKP